MAGLSRVPLQVHVAINKLKATRLETVERQADTLAWFLFGGYISLHTTALDDDFWAYGSMLACVVSLATRALARGARWLRLRRLRASNPPKADEAPVPMLLECPRCGEPHVDEGEWASRPHRTHLCEFCDNEFSPCPYATVGVLEEQPDGEAN